MPFLLSSFCQTASSHGCARLREVLHSDRREPLIFGLKTWTGPLSVVFAIVLAMMALPRPAAAETGAERIHRIRSISFSPTQCYRVRDLMLEREDFKLYFTDGYLLFAEPIEGHVVAAVFLAASDTGEGEIVLVPPTPSERQSLARFAGAPVLEESLRTALMFFTDDTAQALHRAMAENSFNHPDQQAGEKLAPDWQVVVRNMITNYDARMLMDLLTDQPPGGSPRTGFFAASISGVNLERFDILLDPLRFEHVVMGQVVFQNAQRYYDIWTSFPARSFRARGAAKERQPIIDPGSLEHYRIEASILPDLSMAVAARLSFTGGGIRQSGILFEISAQMKVSQVKLDGRPAEFLQGGALDSSTTRRRGDDWVLVISDDPIEPGSQHEFEFHYAGNVVTDAGRGVYFVGARGNWYPSRGYKFTDFDLLFHYPKKLQMVATGRQVETSVEGDTRITRWRPDAPIRVAGFNLGDFQRTTMQVGQYTLEVCANKSFEPALQPVPVSPSPPMEPPRRRPAFRPAIPPGETLPDPPANPSRRLPEVTRDSEEALQFYTQRFGPLPFKHLAISPIPGGFGQGFPGLVYISTLSYYDPNDKPLERLNSSTRVFYSEQLRAHEIAHQWWGNTLTEQDYHDLWLMESLADYSALLFLEQHKGPDVLAGILARYKANLLEKNETGETVESAGAIVLGDRLRTSRTPRARETITYEKGTWVLHMLRRIMGDQKFFAMLAELRRKYEYKTVSTEQFRELAAQFVPANFEDPTLENFFATWVYSTGIPTLEMHYKVSGSAPPFKLNGVIKQSGAAEDFTVRVPVEIQVAGGPVTQTRVQTANGETTFSVSLKQRPVRVLLDPRDSVLAIKPQ